MQNLIELSAPVKLSCDVHTGEKIRTKTIQFVATARTVIIIELGTGSYSDSSDSEN